MQQQIADLILFYLVFSMLISYVLGFALGFFMKLRPEVINPLMYQHLTAIIIPLISYIIVYLIIRVL